MFGIMPTDSRFAHFFGSWEKQGQISIPRDIFPKTGCHYRFGFMHKEPIITTERVDDIVLHHHQYARLLDIDWRRHL